MHVQRGKPLTLAVCPHCCSRV